MNKENNNDEFIKEENLNNDELEEISGGSKPTSKPAVHLRYDGRINFNGHQEIWYSDRKRP